MRPLEPIEILPGLYTIQTDRGSKNRWKNGNKVRFHKGMPQKLGGWEASGEETFVGVCRGISDWQSLATERLIALGTHLKLYVQASGSYHNITPLSSSGTFANNPITTTSGSVSVNIAHVGHGRLVGDYVVIAGATAVGGITLSGEYQVHHVSNSDNYSVIHSSAATSGATGGGAAVTYKYEIAVGNSSSLYGKGWGAGAYSESTWGTPRTASNFLSSARIWSLDQWSEDLIACPRGGGIYVWDTSAGTSSRATLISGAPSTAKAIFVSPENKHLVALGAHSGTANDPLLIRWSTSEDYTNWTAASTNSAGQKRLSTGNEIMCGVKSNKEILIFTDSHLWTMVFTGPPNVFSFTPIGKNGGIRGQNAACEHSGIVYWMSEKDFYFYDGSAAKVLPCDVWPTIFENANYVQRAKTFAGVNGRFGEIWWFYCSELATECDRYVVYNTMDATWTFGTLNRTAFIGDSALFSVPFATDENGVMYDHETGVDANGSAMESSLESYDVEIGNGDYMVQVGMMVPDFKVLTGSISMQLKAKKYPQDTETVSDSTLTILPGTKFVNPRVKGRQISVAFTASAVGDNWRLGTMRFGAREHGKK